MAIPPVTATGIALPTLPTQPTGATAPSATEPGRFGGEVVKALDELDATQKQSEQLAVKAATGDLQDAHDFMIASTRAGLATELTVAVRNRAVEAFTSVMQMGI